MNYDDFWKPKNVHIAGIFVFLFCLGTPFLSSRKQQWEGALLQTVTIEVLEFDTVDKQLPCCVFKSRGVALCITVVLRDGICAHALFSDSHTLLIF